MRILTFKTHCVQRFTSERFGGACALPHLPHPASRWAGGGPVMADCRLGWTPPGPAGTAFPLAEEGRGGRAAAKDGKRKDESLFPC